MAVCLHCSPTKLNYWQVPHACIYQFRIHNNDVNSPSSNWLSIMCGFQWYMRNKPNYCYNTILYYISATA